MSCAFSDPTEIVRRNTRNGYTAWQNVAMQLGQSLDLVRSLYDPTYGPKAQIHAQPKPQHVIPFPGLEPGDHEIIARLANKPADANTLAVYIPQNLKSVRVRLSKLHGKGIVERDRGQRPCVWRLKVIADHG